MDQLRVHCCHVTVLQSKHTLKIKKIDSEELPHFLLRPAELENKCTGEEIGAKYSQFFCPCTYMYMYMPVHTCTTCMQRLNTIMHVYV